MIGGSSTGRGWEFLPSPPCSERLWGPSSLLSNGHQVLLPGVWIWPLTPIYCRGEECVEAYLHSPNTPSWHGAQLKHRDNLLFSNDEVGSNYPSTVGVKPQEYPKFFVEIGSYLMVSNLIGMIPMWSTLRHIVLQIFLINIYWNARK
jgi:hypothetical protein